MDRDLLNKIFERPVGYSSYIIVRDELKPDHACAVSFCRLVAPMHEVVLESTDALFAFHQRHFSARLRQASSIMPIWIRSECVSGRTVLSMLASKALIVDKLTYIGIQNLVYGFPVPLYARTQRHVVSDWLFFSLQHASRLVLRTFLETNPHTPMLKP